MLLGILSDFDVLWTKKERREGRKEGRKEDRKTNNR
jgi:hypothetical protein